MNLYCSSLNAVFFFSYTARRVLVYTRGSRFISISLFIITEPAMGHRGRGNPGSLCREFGAIKNLLFKPGLGQNITVHVSLIARTLWVFKFCLLGSFNFILPKLLRGRKMCTANQTIICDSMTRSSPWHDPRGWLDVVKRAPVNQPVWLIHRLVLCRLWEDRLAEHFGKTKNYDLAFV